MKRIAKGFPVLSLCLLLMLAAATTNPTSLAQSKPAQKSEPAAQAPMAPQWLSVTVVHIKPELVLEYQDFMKNEALPTLQKGGMKSRETWTTAGFGESFEYVYVTPIDNFAQYDGPGPIVKALGEEGARAYGAKVRRFLSSSQTYAVQTRPDLSYMGKMSGPPKMAVVNWIHIAPGRNVDFENVIKNDIVPALKKADVLGYFVSQTVHGGDVNEYVTLTIVENFAEIGKGSPVIRGMGGQEAFNKFLSKVSGIIAHQERSVMRLVPELSFTAPVKAENK